MIQKLMGAVLALSLFVPVIALADSNVTAQSDAGSSINPSGLTIVPTGVTQVFDISAHNGYRVSDISVDGLSQSIANTLAFTGINADTVNHVVSVSSVLFGGGAMTWCSGPMAPGYNISLSGGGCGATTTFVPFNHPIPGGVCTFTSGCMVPKQ